MLKIDHRPLRLLLVEDREDDELLVVRELRRGGYEVVHERVESKPAMRAALAQGSWDLIICDYSMPQFSAQAALDTLKESGHDIPFILVSGTVGDELAVEHLHSGAQDFISKTNLNRLLPAVARELADAQDRRERRFAEAQLRESTHTLSAVFSASPLPIIAVDRAGNVTRWNPAAERVFGWSADEVIGRHVPFVAGDGGAFNQRLRRVLSGESVSNEEIIRPVRSGKPLTFLVSAAPLRDSDGAIQGMVGVMVDITEARRLEDELRHAQKMEAVGRLAGGVAHDFNNVLTAISGYASLVLEDLPSDDTRRSDVLEIVHAAERATAFTRQLLAFSRKQVIQPSLIDVDHVARDLLSMLRRLIGEHIDLRLELNGGGQLVLVDRSQLEQIIMNLVINASDALPDGGVITIRTQRKLVTRRSGEGGQPTGPCIVLEVEDTGSGIAPDVIEHMFEPFFTTKEPGKGTGLGLSTTYGLVRQANGEIRVRTALGQGTTFRVLLPIAEAAGATPVVAAQPAAGTTERPAGCVLVVEDDASVRKLVQRALQRARYDAIVVARPSEALDVLSNGEKVDLLLTDVMLPEMSGPELFERARELRRDLRCAFTSGYTEEELHLPAGCVFVEKPFTSKELLDAVRRGLS